MEKPTPAALAAFDRAFPADDRAIRKKMFGMPGGFVNGNMFLGVFANGVVIRLPEAERDAASAMPGVGPFEPMEGRPWREYIHADADRYHDTDQLRAWADAALAWVATMPPKEVKVRKKKA